MSATSPRNVQVERSEFIAAALLTWTSLPRTFLTCTYVCVCVACIDPRPILTTYYCRTLPFDQLIELASSTLEEQYYYLRSLGDNPRKDVADFHRDFPELSSDLNLPQLFPSEQKFSSVFRVSSANLCLWIHYDVRIATSDCCIHAYTNVVFVFSGDG